MTSGFIIIIKMKEYKATELAHMSIKIMILEEKGEYELSNCVNCIDEAKSLWLVLWYQIPEVGYAPWQASCCDSGRGQLWSCHTGCLNGFCGRACEGQ